MKRSFSVPSSSISTEIPLIQEGIYNAIMNKPSVVSKANVPFIKIVQERGKWDREKVSAKGRQGDWEYPVDANGKPIYTLEGRIYFSAILTDEKAKEILQKDEPVIGGGQVALHFNSAEHEEAFTLNKDKNIPYGSWLKAVGLFEEDVEDYISWEYDEDVTIPEELEGIDYAVDLVNALNYHIAYFTYICSLANKVAIKVKVLKQAKYNDKTQQENVIDTGNYNSFCGIFSAE